MEKLFIIDSKDNKENLTYIKNFLEQNFEIEIIEQINVFDQNNELSEYKSRFATHVSILKLAKEADLSNVTVIEDVCKFVDDFVPRYKLIKEYLDAEPGWYIYLGGCSKINSTSALSKSGYDLETFVQIKKANCFYFVCYSNLVYDKFINSDMSEPIDKFWHGKFNAIVSVPFVSSHIPVIDKQSNKMIYPNIPISQSEELLKSYINTNFNKDIYVINLAESVQRYKLIKERFPEFNIFKVNAIRHDEGWKGCFASHIKCIQIAKEKKLKNIFVIEDDCVPVKKYKERLLKIRDILDDNEDWKIYLGGCNRTNNYDIRKKVKLNGEDFVYITSGSCLHMVYYNEKIYDYLLNCTMYTQIDKVWCDFTTAIVSVPFLAYQEPFYSHITGQEENYLRPLRKQNQMFIDYIQTHTHIDLFIIISNDESDKLKYIREKYASFNINLVYSDKNPNEWKNTLASHIKCIEIAKKHGYKNIIVVEENCKPVDDFRDRFVKIKKYLDTNEDWVVYLGGCSSASEDNILQKLYDEASGETFFELNNAGCSHFVCYSDIIYDHMMSSKLTEPINKHWLKFCNLTVSYPFIASQLPHYNNDQTKLLKLDKKIKYTENIFEKWIENN